MFTWIHSLKDNSLITIVVTLFTFILSSKTTHAAELVPPISTDSDLEVKSKMAQYATPRWGVETSEL